MLEKTIERKFLKKLESLEGVTSIKLSMNGARGSAGWPDRQILLPGGVSIFIEFKAPGNWPTKLQCQRIQQLIGLGFEAEWHDDANEAFAFVLKQLRKQVKR